MSKTTTVLVLDTEYARAAVPGLIGLEVEATPIKASSIEAVEAQVMQLSTGEKLINDAIDTEFEVVGN